MTSLADPASSFAGGVTDLTVAVRVRTEEMTFLREGVLNGLVYCDSEMDCGDCALPDAWCQEMPEICDDLHCQYINYVGCDPDCVD